MNNGNNAGKVGVTNLQKIVLLIVAIFNQALESFKDGIQASDFTGFIDEFMAIAAASTAFKEIRAEVADLETSEVNQIKEAVKAELKIANPVVDELVDAILDWIVATAVVVEKARRVREWRKQNK